MLDLGEDSRIILYPPLDMTHSANEQGLSVLAQMEETSVLVTGDMNARTEQMLLRYVELPDTDLLIAGHHGSDDSTSQALLEKITPDVCIISVGAHNRYGHPGEGALERLTVSGAEIYRTDHSGHVTLTLN
jgi:competence protein ComEC